MLKVEQRTGVEGLYKVIVRRPDGSIKQETDFQKNLFLDNGIKVLLNIPIQATNENGEIVRSHYDGGLFSQNSLMNGCCVGTGNSEPQVDNIKLDQFVSYSSSTKDRDYGIEHPEDNLHPGYAKLWSLKTFLFSDINNKNITELGLGQDHISYSTAVSLVTRTLIKDKEGVPISITVLEGEILEVIYQINMYVDIRKKTGSFTLITEEFSEETQDTFDYFALITNINSNSFTHSVSNINHTTTYGVKETDDELTADYDLEDEVYSSFTYQDQPKLSDKISSSHITENYYSSKYSNRHQSVQLVHRDFNTKSQSFKTICGPYSHFHTNGIRAFSLSLYMCHLFVVVKNRKNGQGIKKNDKQLWEYIVEHKVDRWIEPPKEV